MKKFSLSVVFVLIVSGLLLRAEVTPENSTGVEPIYSYSFYKMGMQEAINLYNANVSVTVPLVNLKGRAGQDLSLALSHQSTQFETWMEGDYQYCDWLNLGTLTGRWGTNFTPSISENSWLDWDNQCYVYTADITLDGGTRLYFETCHPYYWPPTDVRSINSTDLIYDFDAHKLHLKNGTLV